MTKLASAAVIAGGLLWAGCLTLLAGTEIAKETALRWGPFAGIVLVVTGGLLLGVVGAVPRAPFRGDLRVCVLALGSGLALIVAATVAVVDAAIAGPIGAIALMVVGLVIALLALSSGSLKLRFLGLLVAIGAVALPAVVAGTHPECGPFAARTLAQLCVISLAALGWTWFGVVALREAELDEAARRDSSPALPGLF